MKKIALILSVMLVAACGFEPMYGRNVNESVGVENELALVEIGGIPDREGQYLRNALIDRFYRNGRPVAPRYELSAQEVQEHLVDLDITKSSDATRGQLRLGTTIYLKDKSTDKTVLERSLNSTTSYNILGSEFATRVTEDNARQNALDDLARQIELQLNLYFKRN